MKYHPPGLFRDGIDVFITRGNSVDITHSSCFASEGQAGPPCSYGLAKFPADLLTAQRLRSVGATGKGGMPYKERRLGVN